MNPLGKTSLEALARASKRAGHFVCPIRGAWAACESSVLKALESRGLITDTCIPVLTDYGLAVAEEYLSTREGTR